MKVLLCKYTYWDTQRLKPGDTADVPDDIAARWKSARIAELIEEPVLTDEEKAIGKMSKDELIAKAEALGIDISDASNNPQRVEMILAHLAEDKE